LDTSHPILQDQVAVTQDVADGDTDVSPPLYETDRAHGTIAGGLLAGNNLYGEGIQGSALDTAELIFIKATKNTAYGTDITHGIEGVVAAAQQ